MSGDPQQQKFQAVIKKILAEPENKMCFTCTQKGPTYLVVPYTIFVCTKCSGLHREFSFRVKGISMSNFTSEEVEEIKKGGNGVARKLWLATWSPDDYELPEHGDEKRIKSFIRLVFIKGQWKEIPPSEPLENLVGREAVESLKQGARKPPPSQPTGRFEGNNGGSAQQRGNARRDDDWDPWGPSSQPAPPPAQVRSQPPPQTPQHAQPLQHPQTPFPQQTLPQPLPQTPFPQQTLPQQPIQQQAPAFHNPFDNLPHTKPTNPTPAHPVDPFSPFPTQTQPTYTQPSKPVDLHTLFVSGSQATGAPSAAVPAQQPTAQQLYMLQQQQLQQQQLQQQQLQQQQLQQLQQQQLQQLQLLQQQQIQQQLQFQQQLGAYPYNVQMVSNTPVTSQWQVPPSTQSLPQTSTTGQTPSTRPDAFSGLLGGFGSRI